MYQLTAIFLFFLIAAQSSNTPNTAAHGLYLSVIEIQHPSLSPTADLKMKIFKDDLQNALRNAFPDTPPPDKELLCENGQADLQAYFNKHVFCEINGQKLVLEWNGCEKNNDAYWFFYKIKCPQEWKAFRLKADFLMELYPAQANMLQLTNGADKRFVRLTKKESTCEVLW
ncbi:MAG TPA: hypothetical protein ENJ95_17145 [Bacteroidetes bacterium]|nr:hypothetical protein [Bacteroidota bacterium]